MKPMPPLLILGSINADLYVRLTRLPAAGETLPGREAAVRTGGKGANQAVAAARLGHPVRFAGQVGDDAFGPALRQAVRSHGVADDLLATIPGPSGQAMVLLQDGGENSIILVGGANQAWAGLPPAVAEAIGQAGALLLQREIPGSINLAAARRARQAGIPVWLDAGGGDGPLEPELVTLLDLVSPNETELAQLTGMPTDDEAQVVAAGLRLQAAGAAEVLVKLGARGSLLLDRQGRCWQQGIVPVEVVDTTGAGDCFTASYLVALREGQSPGDRLAFAAAAAARCVTRLGAMESMPLREELVGWERNQE